MKHFLLMLLFAGTVAVSFGLLGKETRGERVRGGAKVFLEFVLAGLAISWVLYLLT